MKIMTNKELTEKLIHIATGLKTLYVMGGFGAPLNEKNKARYTQNHSYNKAVKRTKMIMDATEDTFAFDCVCLIKGVLWGFSGDTTKTYGGAVYASNGVPDKGTEGFFKMCSDISEDFSNIEIGEMVHMKGHVGVYVGDDLVVECSPAFANKVQITTINKENVAYPYRKWTDHGKMPWIDYVETEIDITEYYPSTRYKGCSIVDGLKSIRVNSSFAHRATIALANNIEGYRGTAYQNTRMLMLLKQGKLVKPKGE